MNLSTYPTQSASGRSFAPTRTRARPRPRLRALAVAAALGLIAAPTLLSCTGFGVSDPVDESEGELGNGVFRYSCLSSGKTDAACLFTNTPEFPEVVAVEAPFAMDYSKDPDAEVDSPATLAVQPSSERMITRVEGVFTPKEAGYTALLALSANSDVVDLIHLRIATVARVGFWNESKLEITEINVAEGEVVTVAGVPFTASDDPLGGSLPFAWTIEDETIARVVTDASYNLIEIEGQQPGITTLSVDVGGVVQTLQLTVEDGVATTTGTETTTDDATTDDTDGTTTDDMTTGTTDDMTGTTVDTGETGTTGPLVEDPLDDLHADGGQP